MEQKFNKKAYDINYHKEKLSKFTVDLKKEEFNELNMLLKQFGLSKADFLRMSIKNFKEENKVNDKILKIDSLIENIINKAIEAYTEQFDENKGMSIEDWKNGYKGTIYNYEGKIVNYVSISDFESLYNNFKYDLNKAKNKQLDNIINYLNEEAKYTKYNDLDKDTFWLEDFN